MVSDPTGVSYVPDIDYCYHAVYGSQLKHDQLALLQGL